MILVIVAVVVVVLAAIAGAVALMRKRGRDAAIRQEQEEGANEFLQSPPTSFPTFASETAKAAPAHAAIEPGSAGALPAGPSLADSSLADSSLADSSPIDPSPAVHIPEHATVEDLAAAKILPADAASAEPTKTDGAEQAEEIEAAAEVAAPAHAEPDAPVEAEAGSPTAPAHVEPATEAESQATEVETTEPAAAEAGDEVAVSRFRAPGYLSASQTAPVPAPATRPTYPLAAEAPASADDPKSEPAHGEVAADAEAAPRALSVVNDDEVVIDLASTETSGDTDAAAEEQAWRDVALEPEPDAVDHVLQALINRARFKQVGVEEVATELVERADLRGEEVSDVLAELVGRADTQILDSGRSSELVLFNEAVPSRPGQLTDFAKLAPVDKKRIIIRVLCLLVARSEDQQLPPRAGGDTPSTSWPLARAVWPMGGSDDDAEGVLPSRLAKSG